MALVKMVCSGDSADAFLVFHKACATWATGLRMAPTTTSLRIAPWTAAMSMATPPIVCWFVLGVRIVTVPQAGLPQPLLTDSWYRQVV